mgnify:CR=1 FL=1
MINLLAEDKDLNRVIDNVLGLTTYDNSSPEYCLLHLWTQQELEAEMKRAALNVAKQYSFSLGSRKRLLAKVFDEYGYPETTLKSLEVDKQLR